MTAKEQAKELIEKFYQLIFDIDLGSNVIKDKKRLQAARKCALISIDREIESMLWLNLFCPFDNYMKEFLNLKIEELKEVKQEIKKL